jgi:hypothetical protein
MIKLSQLTNIDIGRHVVYTNGIGNKEFGRIKDWNDKWVFVVYHCDDQWKNYRDYTAAATSPYDLEFESPENWDPETTRFDLIDFD